MISKTKNKKHVVLKKGDVCIVALSPTVGTEINKTRPAVIISNNHMNKLARTVMVMPITTGAYSYYHWINILPPEGGLLASSQIVTDQIRTIDKQRIQKRIGKITAKTLLLIEQAIKNNFALPEGDVLA